MSMVLPGVQPGGLGVGAYQGQLNENPAYLTAFNNTVNNTQSIINQHLQTAQAATPPAMTAMNAVPGITSQEQQGSLNAVNNTSQMYQADEQAKAQQAQMEAIATQAAQAAAQQAQQNAEAYAQAGFGQIGGSGGGVGPSGLLNYSGGDGSFVNPSAKGARSQYQYSPNGVSGGGTNANDTYYWQGEGGLGTERNQIMSDAFSYIGDPYKLGGTTARGIDCSGLVMAVYDQFGFGKYLNSHDAGVQGQEIPGVRTSVSNLQPGDLVAWNDGSHIAIYAGNGMIVAAATEGEGVKLQPVWGNVTGIHLNLPTASPTKTPY